MEPLSILLVDDHAPTRQAVESLVKEHADFQIVGQAASGTEGVDMARALRPDVIVMDIVMPAMNGIDATTAICRENPQARVLTLSNHIAMGFVNAMFAAGAIGYIRKDQAYTELAPAIRAVAAGEPFLGSRLGD